MIRSNKHSLLPWQHASEKNVQQQFAVEYREQKKSALHMPDPTFLIIGTQKGGTTWLCDMIRQHPDVFCPEEKELHFFNKADRYERGLSWYRGQFQEHRGERAVGEATPNYLWTTSDRREIEESRRLPAIPERVHRHYPDLKFIVSLRDPVERAVSAYRHHIRARRVSLRSRILDVATQYGILTMGYYQKHLEHWWRVFGRDRFLVLIFEEDIKQNRRATLQRVFRFLKVDDQFLPDSLDMPRNARLGPFYRSMNYYAPWIKPLAKRFFPGIRRFLPSLSRKSTTGKLATPELTEEERAVLGRRFAEANAGLEQLLGRQLPWPCMQQLSTEAGPSHTSQTPGT